MQNKEIVDKMTATFMEKYGVSTPLLLKETKDKN